MNWWFSVESLSVRFVVLVFRGQPKTSVANCRTDVDCGRKMELLCSVVLLNVFRCQLTYILGTSWDQCRSMVQHCFASTETVRLVRTESPGRPPRLTLTQLLNYVPCALHKAVFAVTLPFDCGPAVCKKVSLRKYPVLLRMEKYHRNSQQNAHTTRWCS